MLLPQPNLSCRLYRHSLQRFLEAASRVVCLGSGTLQFFNDEAVAPPSLEAHGITRENARDYAIVGCVELTTHGNSLAWSDAVMFNLVKVLELTINHGVDLLSSKQIELDLGDLTTYRSFSELEVAFATQIDYFADRMVECITAVEAMHELLLPTPFLSSIIDDCITRGLDVTQGGHYNFAGVQAIQVANVADSLATIQELVYNKGTLSAGRLLHALQTNYADDELACVILQNKAPKYGNDVTWVDDLGAKWVNYFADCLQKYRNRRGGIYQMGLYTVSAHVPMGQNVGASADGRRAGEPLADGGVSAMYGRDTSGPTALLHSVARLPFCVHRSAKSARPAKLSSGSA